MASSGGGRSAPASGLWPPPPHGWLPFGGVALIYIGHLLYGALVGDVALALDIAAALLAGAALAAPSVRADLLRLKGLHAAGILFAIVLCVGLWSLTPYVPGGPHPVWSYVGQRGAATVDRSTTAVELVKLLGLACFFLVGAATGGRDDRARWAAHLAVVAGALFGMWAIVVAATGAIPQTQGHRLEALFLNPNTAANLFAGLLVLSVAAFDREVRTAPRGAATFALGLSIGVLGAALLNTASRGGALAAVIGLGAYLLLRLTTRSIRPSRGLLAGLASLALLGVLVVVAGETVIERFFQAEQDAPARYAIWQTHWEAFLRSPLLGYGLGNFEPVNRSLLDAANFDTLSGLRAPLNVYLQWLEEGGLLMAAPMFLCIGWLVWLTCRGLMRRSRMTALLSGLLALNLTFLVQGATDSALQTPSVAAFWAWALGLQVALAQGSSRR